MFTTHEKISSPLTNYIINTHKQTIFSSLTNHLLTIQKSSPHHSQTNHLFTTDKPPFYHSPSLPHTDHIITTCKLSLHSQSFSLSLTNHVMSQINHVLTTQKQTIFHHSQTNRLITTYKPYSYNSQAVSSPLTKQISSPFINHLLTTCKPSHHLQTPSLLQINNLFITHKKSPNHSQTIFAPLTETNNLFISHKPYFHHPQIYLITPKTIIVWNYSVKIF